MEMMIYLCSTYQKEVGGQLKSLVIGFCRCAKCGGNYKFNWHTYFKCPECKGNQFQKWGDPFNEEKNTNNNNGILDYDDSIFAVSSWE